jgi:hypothetical protein
MAAALEPPHYGGSDPAAGFLFVAGTVMKAGMALELKTKNALLNCGPFFN